MVSRCPIASAEPVLGLTSAALLSVATSPMPAPTIEELGNAVSSSVQKAVLAAPAAPKDWSILGRLMGQNPKRLLADCLMYLVAGLLVGAVRDKLCKEMKATVKSVVADDTKADKKDQQKNRKEETQH